eukprot:TRINITY_DN20208_c0_g1_i1.p1 TRINITY_DN20208_c0_g1~~TRINITY_DN20208_c0_g1_i1.p1  ORF type:complete len:102 (-),score=57.15 TRINITY_DN20208_c0_g1_i1:32-337(-)
MNRRPPRSTQSRSSAASDVYKRQVEHHWLVSIVDLNVSFCDGGELQLVDGAAVAVVQHTHAILQQRSCLVSSHLRAVLSDCLLYTSPSPRDRTRSRMPSSA